MPHFHTIEATANVQLLSVLTTNDIKAITLKSGSSPGLEVSLDFSWIVYSLFEADTCMYKYNKSQLPATFN